MEHDTTLSDAAISSVLTEIEPTWTLRDAMPIETGQHAVYRLTVESTDGIETCVLKATPGGKDPTVDLEARLLAVLDAHTSIPVPTVIGAVDHHETLPAPFVLLEALAGETIPRTDLPSITDDVLRRIARASGRYLADLHSVDAVDAFGFLDWEGPDLLGDRPSGDPRTILVADPVADWQRRLHDWADGTFARIQETRFADVSPEVGPELRSRIEDLAGPFEPALARIDHTTEHVSIDEGDPVGVLDWEFTIAATRAYDLACVAWSLAGGPYLFHPAVADRRDVLFDCLLDGYLEAGTVDVDQVQANRDCYDLLSTLRSMVHLEDWYELYDLGDEIDDAAVDLRKEVRASL